MMVLRLLPSCLGGVVTGLLGAYLSYLHDRHRHWRELVTESVNYTIKAEELMRVGSILSWSYSDILHVYRHMDYFTERLNDGLRHRFCSHRPIAQDTLRRCQVMMAQMNLVMAGCDDGE